jgi:hypothetical protein
MRIARLITAVSLALWWPCAARAYFADGNELFSECSVKPADPDYASKSQLCLGYVVGVIDSREFELGAELCASPKPTKEQIRDTVVEYLKKNPAQRALPAAALVVNALLQGFPCQR